MQSTFLPPLALIYINLTAFRNAFTSSHSGSGAKDDKDRNTPPCGFCREGKRGIGGCVEIPTHHPLRAPATDLDRPSRLTTDVREKLDELQDTCRIEYLRHFSLDPKGSVIRQVWDNDINKHDWEWQASWVRLINHNSNWKGRSIAYMKVRTHCFSHSNLKADDTLSAPDSTMDA